MYHQFRDVPPAIIIPIIFRSIVLELRGFYGWSVCRFVLDASRQFVLVLDWGCVPIESVEWARLPLAKVIPKILYAKSGLGGPTTHPARGRSGTLIKVYTFLGSESKIRS